MDEATVCYPRRGTEVLLIHKKRGLGEGLYNGPGGKVEPGETVRECVRREVREEVGLRVTDAAKRAEFRFVFGDEPVMHVHAFVADGFEGTPRETPEARPEWFPVEEIPYDEMWADDRHWFPRALDGERVAGRFEFDAAGDELLAWRLDPAPGPGDEAGDGHGSPVSGDAGPPWDDFDFEAPADPEAAAGD